MTARSARSESASQMTRFSASTGRHPVRAVRWKGSRRYLGHLLGSGPDRRLAPGGDAGTPALGPPTAWCAPVGRQARRAGMCHDACGADVPARESDRSRQDFQDSHPTRRLLWPTDGLAGVRGIPALARTPQGGAPFVNMRDVNERVADRQRWPWRTIMQPGCDVTLGPTATVLIRGRDTGLAPTPLVSASAGHGTSESPNSLAATTWWTGSLCFARTVRGRSISNHRDFSAGSVEMMKPA